jgi:simple sugar transport system permease protein
MTIEATLKTERKRTASRAVNGRLRAALLRPELTALISTIAVFAFFAISAGSAGFLTFTGVRNFLQVAAIIGIVATPLTLLMVAGEFDLSVGVMIGTAGIAVAFPVVHLGWPLWGGIVSGLAVATIVGTINGIFVTQVRIPSFLVTLGMMFVLRGVTLAGTLLLAGTTQIFGIKSKLAGDPLLPLFSGDLAGLPVAIYWWLGLTVLAAYVLDNTKQGNWILASGGDADAAYKMGVPVSAVKIGLYIVTACSAVIVAMLNMFYVDMADVAQGLGKEFEAITAAVVGGTAITGGLGSPYGTALGALMFGMMSQGFFYTEINDSWFYAVVGGMLLIAVTVNTYTRRAALVSRVRK